MPPVELTVVVPFFNEAHRLGQTLAQIVALAGADVEVILVDDGSNDGTPDSLDIAARATPGVEVVRIPHNRGKGAALRAGVARSTGDHLVFMDADLATDLSDLPLLRRALDDAEVAIGTRATDAAEIHDATWLRTAMGGVFNRAVRISSGLRLRDTQCGFKAFRGDVGRWLFAHSSTDGFAFDVEVLMLANRCGMRIAEVPVRWTEVPGSKVRFADPFKMSWDLLRIRRRVRLVLRSPDPGVAELNEVAVAAPTPSTAPHRAGRSESPGCTSPRSQRG